MKYHVVNMSDSSRVFGATEAKINIALVYRIMNKLTQPAALLHMQISHTHDARQSFNDYNSIQTSTSHALRISL